MKEGVVDVQDNDEAPLFFERIQIFSLLLHSQPPSELKSVANGCVVLVVSLLLQLPTLYAHPAEQRLVLAVFIMVIHFK